jgi:hypothetical protein
MVEPFNAATVKVVCSICNSGWMNELEEASRDTLTALVQGSARPVDANALSDLATWAVKTSLMVQLTGVEPADLESSYHDLYSDRKPQPNTVVWVAAVDHEEWALRAESITIVYADGSRPMSVEDPPNTLCVTLGLGSLLLQTIITALAEVPYPPLDELAPGAVIRIWPDPRPIVWPPVRPLHVAEAWSISRSLATLLS